MPGAVLKFKFYPRKEKKIDISRILNRPETYVLRKTGTTKKPSKYQKDDFAILRRTNLSK